MNRPDFIRRVYELPADLADAVQDHALARQQTEVASVRQLLEEALSRRESGRELDARAKALALKAGPREVLAMVVMHPQTSHIERNIGSTRVRCADGHVFDIAGGSQA